MLPGPAAPAGAVDHSLAPTEQIQQASKETRGNQQPAASRPRRHARHHTKRLSRIPWACPDRNLEKILLRDPDQSNVGTDLQFACTFKGIEGGAAKPPDRPEQQGGERVVRSGSGSRRFRGAAI